VQAELVQLSEASGAEASGTEAPGVTGARRCRRAHGAPRAADRDAEEIRRSAPRLAAPRWPEPPLAAARAALTPGRCRGPRRRRERTRCSRSAPLHVQPYPEARRGAARGRALRARIAPATPGESPDRGKIRRWASPQSTYRAPPRRRRAGPKRRAPPSCPRRPSTASFAALVRSEPGGGANGPRPALPWRLEAAPFRPPSPLLRAAPQPAYEPRGHPQLAIRRTGYLPRLLRATVRRRTLLRQRLDPLPQSRLRSSGRHALAPSAGLPR
jgi:hypothetical protein